MSNFERRIDPDNLPNLSHTSILNASIADEELRHVTWNGILGRILCRVLLERGGGLFAGELRKLSHVDIKLGKRILDGDFYHIGQHYQGDKDYFVNYSFKLLSPNGACRAIVRVSGALDIPTHVKFVWDNKKEAAHPGEWAYIKIGK